MIPTAAAAARVCVLVGATSLLVACSSSSGAEKAQQERADELVSAAHSAGVAPRLTASLAESLYGSSAPQVCDVLDGGISSAEDLLLRGNPAGRRAKLVTTDAVTYERLVVKTYCPDELSSFDELVADIDSTDTER